MSELEIKGHQMADLETATFQASKARSRDGRLIVDSQTHIWLANTPERPWVSLDATAQMPEPFTYERLIAIMDAEGIERTVLVTPSWAGGRYGNPYLAQATKAYPDRFGAVGIGINLDDPSQEEVVTNWRDQPGFIGIRPTMTRDSLTTRHSDWFWSAAENAAVPLCFMASGLNSLVGNVAERFPDLTLIVDHMGISQAFMRSNPNWKDEVTIVARLSKYPNISVKISSIPKFSNQPYPWRDTFPLIERCFDSFGPQRCHWGTDQTHTFEKATYTQRITQFTEVIPFFSESDKDWIMGRSVLARMRWPL